MIWTISTLTMTTKTSVLGGSKAVQQILLFCSAVIGYRTFRQPIASVLNVSPPLSARSSGSTQQSPWRLRDRLERRRQGVDPESPPPGLRGSQKDIACSKSDRQRGSQDKVGASGQVKKCPEIRLCKRCLSNRGLPIHWRHYFIVM